MSYNRAVLSYANPHATVVRVRWCTLHVKTMRLLCPHVTIALFVHNGNKHEDNGTTVQPLAMVAVPAAIASRKLLQRVCVGES